MPSLSLLQIFLAVALLVQPNLATSNSDECRRGYRVIARPISHLVANPDGTRRLVPGFHEVVVANNEGATRFAVTNRRLDHLRRLAGSETGADAQIFYDVERLRGRRVLDVGSGDLGEFVHALRESGVEAVGLDLAASAPNRGLVRGNAASLPFASESFDHVYSHTSIFSDLYVHQHNYALRANAFREIVRVLRPGGSFRVGPIRSQAVHDLIRMARQAGNLRVTRYQVPMGEYLEIVKRR